MSIRFRVSENGQWEKCEGEAADLRLVFSHNIDLQKHQKPEAGQYLGDPQRPERTEKVCETMERLAEKRYESVRKNLTGVYVPA
jgi:hypothetical protein